MRKYANKTVAKILRNAKPKLKVKTGIKRPKISIAQRGKKRIKTGL